MKEMTSKKRKKTVQSRKLGTFGGVFTPDVLTILGVIMYLRFGWVVGNAGFGGAVLIVLLAKSVTICTGLSMSSITTNIKIGAGGAYSIISKSLGLEAGGSIGIPFYIAQTLSAALYIFGFTESWRWIFPEHPAILVATIAWILLLVISYISANFAIKVQFIIMAVIGVSLISFLFTPRDPLAQGYLIGNFEDAGFWQVFAIFFPAVTGIMAGANLSGDLKNPRRAIPLGTLSAILVTMVVYIGLAYFLSKMARPEVLRQNQLIMVDMAVWAPAVIAGIMGATLSSALGSMVGAPRILQALAHQKTVPFYKPLSKKTAKNEPRNAIIFTGLVIELALITGNLDMLASLITMFFLVTYGMLNAVVFIQQSMKIISFRPTFRIPRLVPLIGALGCIAIMFLINPMFSFVAICVIIALYVWLERRGLEKQGSGDIRGGLFLAIAQRLSYLAAKFPRYQITWKPDLLVPIDDPRIWAGPLLFIRNISYPSGTLFAFTVKENATEHLENELNDLLHPLHEEGILVNSTVIEDGEFLHGAKLVIQTLKSGVFRPNILFLTLGKETQKDPVIQELVSHATKYELGAMILRQHPRMAFGMQKNINLWLRDKSPNWHLALLIALHLQMNWNATINLVTVTNKDSEKNRLYRFFDSLSDQARMPSQTHYFVLVDSFKKSLQSAPRADINIFGIGEKLDFDLIRQASELTKSSCLFVKDSGVESALA
jgi:amino acid transporter